MGAEPQSAYHATLAQHLRDLGQPCLVLALHPLGESDAELIGEGAGRFVPGGRLGSDDYRAEVAQVDFSEPGFGGVGAVQPFCGMESGEQALTEGEEDLSGNLRLGGIPG